MTYEQFYKIYTNLPMEKRVLSIDEFHGRSLATMLSDIDRLETFIQPIKKEQEFLLEQVANYLIKNDLL